MAPDRNLSTWYMSGCHRWISDHLVGYMLIGHAWIKYVVFFHRKQVFEIFREGSRAIPKTPRKYETTRRVGFFIFSLFLMCSHHIPTMFPKLPHSFLRHLASHFSSHTVRPSLNQHIYIYIDCKGVRDVLDDRGHLEAWQSMYLFWRGKYGVGETYHVPLLHAGKVLLEGPHSGLSPIQNSNRNTS
jgi:hypothetical protein